MSKFGDKQEAITFRVMITPEETGYLRGSSADDFMYDALDGDFLILVEGRSPFQPGSDYRISKDGALKAVPILLFLWRLAEAVNRLRSGQSTQEHVVVTSTAYALHMERQGMEIDLRVQEEGRAGRKDLARTRLSTPELVLQTKSVAELTLLSVLASNPSLENNWSLRGIRAAIEKLRGWAAGT